MGVIWLAQDTKLERPIALKFLSDVLFHDAVARDDLKRETRRSLELTHPHIVRIYDFLEDEEMAAISMEYVDGSNLSTLRVERAQRCFEVDELSAWTADLCRALEYAHDSALIVHRDLKPANLLVGRNGQMKVADFGIACSLQNTAARVSAWNSTGGTLSYMSPQQLRGDLASPSDDIYSVGATLYELLTGKPPFYAGDISLQIRTVEPESMTARRRQSGIIGEPILARWEETVAACLSKTPNQRPASAAELAERLGLDLLPTQRGAGEREMHTVVVRTQERKFPPALEWPVWWRKQYWIALAGAAVVLCGAVALFALRDRPNHSPEIPTAVASSTAPPSPAVEAPIVPAPPAPVVSAPPGGLVINTEPAGAVITVGGQSAVAPAEIQDLPAGWTEVRLVMEDFEPQTIPTQIRSHETVNLGVVTLRRSTGDLELVSEPAGVAYTLLLAEDNTVVREGRTPEIVPKLPTGEYRVRMERPGWPVNEQVVQVERQSTRRVQSEFGEGNLTITTDPPGARVTLGERELGRTPFTVKLPSGAYGPFEVALDGWEPATFSATVETGSATAPAPIMLRPIPPSLEITTEPPGLPFHLFAGAVESPGADPVYTGEAPAVLDHLEPGPYRVVFDAAPWPGRSDAVEVAERGPTRFQQVFPHGTLKVESLPAGAEIYYGDDAIGIAPLEIPMPSGSHVLTAEFNDRTSRPRTVVVKEGGQHSVRFDFRTSESSTSGRRTHRPKKAAEPSTFTKIGRSLKTFFTGEKPNEKSRKKR